jgi:hypothetical protein
VPPKKRKERKKPGRAISASKIDFRTKGEREILHSEKWDQVIKKV